MESMASVAKSRPKLKSKRKKKEVREAISYESYVKILILTTAVFFISRVSIFGSIYPFGISLMLAIIMCDRKNLIFLPIGLLGIYTATMSFYLAGADIFEMTVGAAACYFAGKNGSLASGIHVRVKKNREQALLILTVCIVIAKLAYHAVMDVILTYDIIMAAVEAGILLTLTFSFLHLYENIIEDDTILFAKKSGTFIKKLWHQKKKLGSGICLSIAFMLIYAGILDMEILQLKTVYILGGLFLLAIGWWSGRSLMHDGSEELARKIKNSLIEYSDIFEKLQHTYGRAIERKEPIDQDIRGEIVKCAREAVCKECLLHNDCWELYAGRAKRYILEMAKRYENKMDIDQYAIDEKYGYICKNRELMQVYIGDFVRFYINDYRWQKKIESSREAMAIQFRGIARSIYKIINAMENDKSITARQARPIDIEIGVCCSSKTGGISGDSHICTPLSKHEYMIAISDGMGSGEKASAESLLTVNMLYDFMRAGFDVELALNAMNAMLLMKSAEEIFSTVDLALINLERGRVKLYKIGAAMAFIKRDEAVTAIKQAAPPMGIIDRIQIEDIDLKVVKGDMIIMASDGITEADREDMEGHWLEEAIGQIGSKNPQTVADLITKEASDRYGDRERDDMTVVVAGIR